MHKLSASHAADKNGPRVFDWPGGPARADHPDAAILNLWNVCRDALADMHKANAEADAIKARLSPSAQDGMQSIGIAVWATTARIEECPTSPKRFYTPDELRRYLSGYVGLCRLGDEMAQAQENADALVALLEARRKAFFEEREASGFDAAAERSEAASARCSDTAWEIKDAPAQTLDGLAVKVWLAVESLEDLDSMTALHLRALLDDVRRLSSVPGLDMDPLEGREIDD